MKTSSPRNQTVFFTAILCLAVGGCNLFNTESDDDKDDGPPQPNSGIEFIMAVDGLDYTVFVNGNSIGRLNFRDERASRDLPPGDHVFYIWNNDYSARSQSFYFNLAAHQRRYYALGDGDTPLIWQKSEASERVTSGPPASFVSQNDHQQKLP